MDTKYVFCTILCICANPVGIYINNPSCSQAEGQLKSLIVANLSCENSIRANCFDDEGSTLAALDTFASTANTNTESFGQKSHGFDQLPLPKQRKSGLLSRHSEEL